MRDADADAARPRSARCDLASGARGRVSVVHPHARIFRFGVRRVRRQPRADRAGNRRVYLGGGIAPRILPALRWPFFMQSFLDKSPMDALISRIPVKVILNPGAGLLGAATYASR